MRVVEGVRGVRQSVGSTGGGGKVKGEMRVEVDGRNTWQTQVTPTGGKGVAHVPQQYH